MEALNRAINYEEKTRKAEKKIVTECMKEMDRRRTESEESIWERKGKEIMEKADMKKEELRKKKGRGRNRRKSKRDNGKINQERNRGKKKQNQGI